jgi:hypothetical protein
MSYDAAPTLRAKSKRITTDVAVVFMRRKRKIRRNETQEREILGDA